MDGQTDRGTGRQRQIDGQTDILIDRQAEGQTDRWMDRQRQKDRQTRQTDRQIQTCKTDRQIQTGKTDRQTDRQTQTDRHRQTDRQTDRHRRTETDLEELDDDGAVQALVVVPGQLGRLVVCQPVVVLVGDLRPRLHLQRSAWPPAGQTQ